MHSIRGLVIALFIVSSPLLTRAEPRVSGLITANAGTRFQLADPDGDGVLTHTVSGLAQVSRLGNCYVSFDVAAYPAPAGKPWKLVGTMRLVSAEDKDTVLDLDVSGWVLPDDNTPFGKFHYDALIKSGAGKFEGAWGRADIDGAALFVNPEGTEGTATWLLRGLVLYRR